MVSCSRRCDGMVKSVHHHLYIVMCLKYQGLGESNHFHDTAYFHQRRYVSWQQKVFKEIQRCKIIISLVRNCQWGSTTNFGHNFRSLLYFDIQITEEEQEQKSAQLSLCLAGKTLYSSIWVEIDLHTENYLSRLPRSAWKVCVGVGGWKRIEYLTLA